jgi:hypothetical protein
MYRYWRSSERARVASMALLSGDETRVSSFAREYVTVMGFALSAVRDEGRGLALREAMATRWGVWLSAWDVAREPLARSGRFTWVEALRNFGKRPAAEVPSMSNAGEGEGASRRAGAAPTAASAPGRSNSNDEGSGR